MKKALVFGAALVALTGVAEGIVLLQVKIDPWRLAAVLGALALVLSAFVGLSYSAFVQRLRSWARKSAWVALGTPFLLLIPYFIFAFGTGTYSAWATCRLAAYIAVPIVLLLPDRLRRANRIGWRDLAAMLALGVPVAGHWLEGIWSWPQEIHFFRPFYSVCVGAYAFMVIRNLEGVGYRLGFRKRDMIDGLSNFVAFGLLAVPLGLALNFIHPHTNRVTLGHFALQLFAIYFTIAIPEELLFRGVLQNFLTQSISHYRHPLYGMVIASLVFGAAHLHHAPAPNWRYAILATLAGLFYGNAYRTRQRLSASALTHTLVDTFWHFWF